MKEVQPAEGGKRARPISGIITFFIGDLLRVRGGDRETWGFLQWYEETCATLAQTVLDQT